MKRLITALSVLLISITLAPIAIATAATRDVCAGANTSGSAFCIDSAGKNTPGADNPISGTSGIILRATRLIAVVAGAAAVILIIVGAIQFVTSSGDSGGAKRARETILYALIGLVIIALAQAIVSFVVVRI